MPLPIVYDGIRQPELDIVSIPGLPSLSPKYKQKDHSPWLREVLGHQIPRARIMAFQYEYGKNSVVSSWQELLDQSASLLYALSYRREGFELRPIVFVCHSFGALILKGALLIAKEKADFRNILKSTSGIVFLGCLHDESHPGFEELSIKCAAVEFGTKKQHGAVESLRKAEDWDKVKEVMESFRRLSAPPFEVRGFFELRPTTYSVGRFMVSKKSECLCPKRVASLGWDNEQLFGVDRDHTHLTMYPHRGDEEFFDIFMSTLSELVDDVCPPDNCPSFTQEPEPLEGGWTLDPMMSALSLSKEAVDIISAHSSLVDLSSLTQPKRREPKTPCHVTTPYKLNKDFVGRQEIVQDIHESLIGGRNTSPGQRTFALTGLGGMGKTQIAIKHAFTHLEAYGIILWAHADGRAKLAESFCMFAFELGLVDQRTTNSIEARRLVTDCLANSKVEWLMVFDNADGDDKQDLFKDFWPKCDRGNVLITSRDQTLIGQFGGVELTVLDEENATNLLFNLTHFSRNRFAGVPQDREIEAAKKIVKRIDYLPLGISQAASLVANDGCSLSEFLEAYDNKQLIEDSEDIRLTHGDSTYKYSLRTVWNMNFDRLSEDAQDLIKVLSFLDPDRIQLRLLNDGASKSQDDSLSFIGTPYKRNKCKVALLQSSLVSQSSDMHELRMHRLVQASCYLRMDLETAQQGFKNAITLLKHTWPVPPRIAVHNPTLWHDQQAYLPHVQALCSNYVASWERGEPLIPNDVADWEFASVLYEAGWYCYERGLLALVEQILLPAEEYCLRHIEKGGGYRILADIYGGLGSFCTESNQFERVYDAFQKHSHYVQLAIEAGELERPTIWEVFALGRLGNAYHGLKQFAEAEKYYRQCLEAWKPLPGDQKIFVTHLGTCLWLQGRPDEGETVLKAIIKDRNDTTNFRTGMAIYALGNIQIAQARIATQDGEKSKAESKFIEAMDSHAQSLKLWTITLGSRHHKTGDALHKVAWHAHRIGQYKQALDSLDQALDIYNENAHLYKNEIARTRYKKGCVLQDSGDKVQGRLEITEAEKIRQLLVPAEKWAPATGEEDFDDIVQFWTR